MCRRAGGGWKRRKKKCNEWKKWVKETGSWAEKPQRRSRGWRGYRYTVFLAETIITMSNGSSHRSLPQPSTVISRKRFFSCLDLMSGDQGSHILHAEHVPTHPPKPFMLESSRHYLGGHFIFRSRDPSMASLVWSIGSHSFTVAYNISRLSSWKKNKTKQKKTRKAKSIIKTWRQNRPSLSSSICLTICEVNWRRWLAWAGVGREGGAGQQAGFRLDAGSSIQENEWRTILLSEYTPDVDIKTQPLAERFPVLQNECAATRSKHPVPVNAVSILFHLLSPLWWIFSIDQIERNHTARIKIWAVIHHLGVQRQ